MAQLFSWVEIPAADFERAVAFYRSVLAVDLQVVDCGVEKMACFPGGEGAVSFAPDFKPSKNGVLVSINVEDALDDVLRRIVENKGTVVREKTKIEADGKAYFALFIDSEGNKLGLYGR